MAGLAVLELASRWVSRWVRSPLSTRGTALPPALLIAARCLALVVLLQGEQPFRLFVPYLAFLDHVGTPWGVQATLRLVSLVGCALLLGTRAARMGCAMIGGSFLLGLLSCRPCLSVAHTYLACVFIMFACSGRRTGADLVRMQLALLYFAASAHKALDPDWWNGQYFDAFMIDRHSNALYGFLAAQLPDGLLGVTLGIATIATQLVLGVLFLRRTSIFAGIGLALMFHGVMVLWLENPFGPFYAALTFSFAALVPWPSEIEPDRSWGGAAALLFLAVLLAGWPLGQSTQLATIAMLTVLAPFLPRRLARFCAGSERRGASATPA